MQGAGNQLVGLGAAVGMALGGGGCGTPQKQESELRQTDLQGLAPPPRPSGSRATPGLAATIDGNGVARDELVPMLEEASGALVLRELALNRAIGEACRARGIVVSDADIEAEQHRLIESIERDARADQPNAGVLLEQLRRSRGLGEVRFRQLLTRNAGLRALIRTSVEVSQTEVEQALRIEYGQKFRVRVIVTSTERQAVDSKRELERDPAVVDIAFARRAMSDSIDASSARGGLLDPISPADQTYPETIRSLLTSLEAGVISPVVAVDQGFAIVLLDSKIEGVVPPEGAEAAAERSVRLRKERLAMEDAARRLLAGVKVVPLDPALVWSWESEQ